MKFEITVHATVEYEPREGDYGTDDPMEMLRIDIEGYTDVPTLIYLDEDAHISISGRIITEE